MIQFLNNIWVALNTSNLTLVNILTIPLYPIEIFLLMNLFLTVLNVVATTKQKITYIIVITTVSMLSLNFIPEPFYIIINYISVLLCINLIFKLNMLKSFIAFVLSTFIFALLNVLFQNPYLTILNITFDTFMNVAIYRIPYLLFLYFILFIFSIILKKVKNIKITLDLLDNLDRNTVILLYINLIIGFVTLCIQLIITTFYIDIVPLIITLLSFILLISFLLLSIYSFTRIIKLSVTTKNLENAEEYNKSLEILYDQVKGFKHDFDNIISTLDGYISTNDINKIKAYFSEIKKDCKLTNDISLLNPRLINNPGIYSLLNNKYFKASTLGVSMNIEFFLDLNTLNVNMYKFSRILGILLDNALEAASICDEKIVRIIFRRETNNRRNIIIIKNTYSNKDVNTDEIFKKGFSGKENHSGIGLWEVKNYIKKSQNLNLFTSKNNKYFSQQLEIYDELRSVI